MGEKEHRMNKPKQTESKGSTPSVDSGDELVFADEGDDLVFEEESEVEETESVGVWKILMIDDDEQVHQSTVLALGDELVLGRKLSFEHARSAKEALEMMAKGGSIPDLAFVDMVMETPDAGLRFAKAAKESSSWNSVKILLRSGQPGFSNEMEQARTLGVEGFAQKASISRSILILALVELLSGRNYFMA